MKKNWLVFARREKCHHREALEKSEHNKYYSDTLGVTVIDNIKIVK